MPSVMSYTQDDVLYHQYDLTDPNLDLDLTSDPWNLQVGQASIVRGLDVIHRGRIAPAGLRKPLGTTNPNATTAALKMAEGSADMNGLTSVRFCDLYNSTDYSGSTTTLVLATGSWPSEMAGGILYQNADGRAGTARTAYIQSVNPAGTLNIYPAVDAWANYDKIDIVYSKSYDKRGIWVTNGRKFWLLNNGSWVLYLDLGSDTPYLGSTWHVCRISYSIVMFVSPTYAPRIVHLGDAAVSSANGNVALAGLLKPCKPRGFESNGDDSDGDTDSAKSWTAIVIGSGGSIAIGSYRILVRAVNLDDGAESETVPVYDESDLDDQDVNVAAGSNSIAVHSYPDSTTREPCPLHERWTHIEVWRTQNAGSAYFLEKRISIAELENEVDTAISAVPSTLVSNDYASCTLSDSALGGQTQLGAIDMISGKAPPMCKRATSLLGVTICAGAADASRTNPTAYNRNFYTNPAADSLSGNGQIVNRAAGYGNYTFQAGDEFVVISCSVAGKAGAYAIASKVSPAALSLVAPGVGSDATSLYGYIRRSYTIDWPYIASDEDVWYSRTDKYAPESFQIANADGTSRILRVSSIGDVLRNLVTVGNYAAMVMASGVHLLYFDTGVLMCDTVISQGGGTPWENSVVVFDNVVLWARPEGVRTLAVSNDPDSDGHRGRLGWLDPEGKTRQWFEDAYNGGYTIDAGIDTHNGTVRFRRQLASDANTFEVLEYSYLNKRWTLIDDDSGAFYVRSRNADTTDEADEILYSVTDQGCAFEVNCFDTTHPYDSAVVQATPTIATGYTVTTTYIQKTGAFDAKMLGDIIRFKTTTGTETEYTRIITAATANRVTFATVTGLTYGWTFYIASPRFCIRWAPLVGKVRDAIKTLRQMIVRAFTGPRNHANANWGDPPSGDLTLSSFRDYHTTAADTNSSEIPVFDEGNAGNLSEDRVSALEGQGSAITLQIATEDTRTDFRLELVKAVIEEESDVRADQSTSA